MTKCLDLKRHGKEVSRKKAQNKKWVKIPTYEMDLAQKSSGFNGLEVGTVVLQLAIPRIELVCPPPVYICMQAFGGTTPKISQNATTKYWKCRHSTNQAMFVPQYCYEWA